MIKTMIIHSKLRIVDVERKIRLKKKVEEVMRKTVKFFATLINIGIVAVCALATHYFLRLPNDFYITEGSSLRLPCFFNVDASPSSPVLQSLSTAITPRTGKVTLKLFGVIPIKDVNVKAVDTPVLVPGGTPFGIKMLTDGVMVIGIGNVTTSEGICSPATAAGIKLGDIVTSVDGEEVASNGDIKDIIAHSRGKSVDVSVKRGGAELMLSLTPVFSQDDNSFRAGMYVRDSTAGIGTVTFFDPATNRFGGLGHPVCDIDTGAILPLSSGEAVGVGISGVNKGLPGNPGELIGSFTTISPIGRLFNNGTCGIFGELYAPPSYASPIPMAMRQEIQLGEATILTTVKGGSPKSYKIAIEKVDLRESDTSKNMVIRITDPELLAISGGIVQGMSGSPILQNGKLVGAVTHVFVNDPARGYGIFCDTMYNAALAAEKPSDRGEELQRAA